MDASSSKVIILSGASKGIGLAIATYLLRQKCNLVLIARSKDALQQLQREYPGQVAVLSGDVNDFSLAEKAVAVAIDRWSHIDGLMINHSTSGPDKRLADSDAATWIACFKTNVLSTTVLMQACIPSLRATKGCIILTSSGATLHAHSSWSSYSSSKSTLNSLAMTLAVGEPDITTLTIRPGVVDTEMQREVREIYHSTMDKRDAENFVSLKKDGQLLQPEQPGHVMARIALNPPRRLSGNSLSWNDHALEDFQS